MIKEQIVTENYALYNGDCMEVVRYIPDNSIDFSVYSPPFAGLYNYSSDYRDFSNCESKEQFLEQYEFLIKELARVTKKGRINAVHVTDIHTNTGRLWDFPGEVIRLHEKYGMEYHNRITVWKEPLKVRMRTMVQSLMHKFIVEDATRCFTAMPDYVLIFRKKGEPDVNVTHPNGLNDYEYFGETPFLDAHKQTYGNYSDFRKKWIGFTGDQRENKLSHLTWQRYASSVWDDVRIDNVLPYKDSKEEDDEKHVHPLQLDVIDRLVYLYTNPSETVLTPFMGVGSEVYSAVSMNRLAIGVELKDSYFKQAKLNINDAPKRFKTFTQQKLF
ncbi:MAG: putative methyltransferase [Bacteroidetes bacterium ADurb.Bin041]|nr:MAG: putative methyltransferase [Bacteroidetes bacterium ADurb.Bin041]